MNKLFYQFVALSTAAVLTAGVFAGCANKDEDDSGTKETAGVMRDMTSMQITQDMTFGWNLGNTLDVCNADRNGDGKIDESSAAVDETLWGNPKATKELFESLKAQGINAVRIPVTWRDHIGDAPDYKIDEDWMNRVQEVVDYAYDLGMYVILNIHHDGGGDPEFGAWVCNAATDEAGVTEKYKAIWSQIAARFQNYSDYLIFESMNEVGFDDLSSADAQALLGRLNQTFVDLIRDSGGNNAKRHLLIAGYWTDVDKTTSSEFVMPTDKENRLIVSVHYYTPWQFCITGENPTWGSDSEIREMQRQVNKLKKAFIDKGIPVLVGEYGASGNKESQLLFYETFVKMTKEIGVPAFLWDNGAIVDRETYEWRIAGLPEALKTAAESNSAADNAA